MDEPSADMQAAFYDAVALLTAMWELTETQGERSDLVRSVMDDLLSGQWSPERVMNVATGLAAMVIGLYVGEWYAEGVDADEVRVRFRALLARAGEFAATGGEPPWLRP